MPKSSQTIVSVALPTRLRKTFDYLCPAEIIPIPMARVLVPFGTRHLIGVILEIKTESDIAKEKLKKIIALLDPVPIIESTVFKLCLWASDYYQHAIGEVMSAAFPIALKRKTLELALTPPPLDLSTAPRQFNLNPAQEKAVNAITAQLGNFNTFLLEGITGSGKTEVYLTAVEAVIKKGEQALILVPEIGLTPQILERFQQRFGNRIACFHSQLSDKEKLENWVRARNGKAAVVIGTRSAIFTSFQKLGLIIIDEEHDLSFKQQSGFRYSARDVAIMRAFLQKIPIVLGSATPSFESIFNTQKKRYLHLSLPERAGKSLHPQYELINICNEKLEHGLSKYLLKAIEATLQKQEQALLFLNRRGYAPILLCHACGWIASCSRCDTKLTLHQTPAHLRCHYCDTERTLDTTCPLCGHHKLIDCGTGTERLEMALLKKFPHIPIIRIDRDTTRAKSSLMNLLNQVQEGGAKILIGTQMITKGHHFPNVTLVGIVNPDGGFFSSDFRASERMGQLLLQVSGRAGREEKLGKVLIQTHYPDHPMILSLLREGYAKFSRELLLERKAAMLPPYTHFALFRSSAFDKLLPLAFFEEVKKEALGLSLPDIQWLGPVPAPVFRHHGRYHAQLLIRSSNRLALQHYLKQLLPIIEGLKISKKIRWSLDIDPLEMYS